MGHFKPVLLSSRISANYVNPGESLWVTLVWQNQGDNPAERDFRFFLKGRYGHQRRLEDKSYDFVEEAEAMPQTSFWCPGETVAVTLKWDVRGDWSGTYWLRVGIIDEEGFLIPFSGEEGRTVYHQEIGSIDTSWNLGRPWVIQNSVPVERQYNQRRNATTGTTERQFLVIQDEAKLELGADSPILYGIYDSDGGYPFTQAYPRAILRDRESGAIFRDREGSCKTEYRLCQHGKHAAVYEGRAFVGETLAAEFQVLAQVERRTAKLTIQSRKEYGDYELLELKYNSLAEMKQGYLVDFWGSGRLVPIEKATPLFFEKRYDVRNAAVLYDDRGMILVESAHIDSRITTGVFSVDGVSRGFVGGSIVSRVMAEKGIPSIPVQKAPVFTIELADLKGKQPDWKVAAVLLRRGVKANGARDLYRHCYFYKQLATWGPMPEEKFRLGDPHPLTQNLFKTVTFSQIAENVRQFSNLTDHAKQVMYVTGWQKGGFDNTYPEPYDAEERCGGLDGLRNCLEESRRYNTFIGLHDNFDDIASAKIESFPCAALDERGEKWRGWMWAAGMTYIMGVKKYAASGLMQERIRRMMNLLPLKDTYHLDLLTAEVCRYDFDPAHPASAEDSFRAKMQIVEEFNRYGIDVTSEMLTHPAVGKIGFALHNRFDTLGTFIPGDQFIPLVQMIYHGIIGYCAPSRSKSEILWSLLLGGQTFYEEDITGELCVSRYYSNNVPAMLLYDKPMTDFRWEGSQARSEFGEGSYIEVDFAAETYCVVVDGRLIGKDFTTFVKGPRDGYLAYSFSGGRMAYPLPEEFSAAAEPKAVCLTTEGDGAGINCFVENGNLVMDMPAMIPVKITAIH